MRISDWSSDVCSSYLWSSERRLLRLHHFHREAERLELRADLRRIADDHPDQVVGPDVSPGGRIQIGGVHRAVPVGTRFVIVVGPFEGRSEERRVGKEGVRTGRYRGARYHKKKNRK